MFKLSRSEKILSHLNTIFLVLIALVCLYPLVYILALSFSSSSAAASGRVSLWPVDITLASYAFIIHKPEFIHALWISVQRVFIAVPLNLLLTILAAYPLSKNPDEFRFRTAYVWFFFITILFNGGLVPWFLTIKATGLMNTIWALVIPNAVNVFNVIILLNFFRGLPKELLEAAYIDGASHWTTLWKIVVPLSPAPLATIALFTFVAHWNSWFDGLILMTRQDQYPLQSYLYTVINIRDNLLALTSGIELSQLNGIYALISDRTIRAAQIFIGGILPVLIVYPFLQRYFMTGIVLGSVKE